jgi:hypothetical protein
MDLFNRFGVVGKDNADDAGVFMQTFLLLQVL